VSFCLFYVYAAVQISTTKIHCTEATISRPTLSTRTIECSYFLNRLHGFTLSCSLFTMKLYNSLIKTMNNVNVNSHHKDDETASRRLSNDSTVPPSTTASSSRRSSMANSLPDANECHDYPLLDNNDGASFMRSSFEQRRTSASTSTAVQARNATSQRRSMSSPLEEGGTTERNEQSDIPRTMNRESSWGNLSIDDI
jgi:hypothetical protein